MQNFLMIVRVTKFFIFLSIVFSIVSCLSSPTKFGTKTEIFDKKDSLKSLEAEFGERFIRVHRNCLVASDQIKELAREADGREIVRLRNDPASLEVSRRCLPGLRQRLKSL